MQTQHTTATTPATIIRSLTLLDEDSQAAIAQALTQIRTSWIKEALTDAIRQQQEDQQAEDAWLEREEARDRYYRGLY